MTSLTIAQIRDAQARYVANGGVNDDSLQAKYYARPLSYPLVWVLSRVGITANQVTILALVFAVAGGFWVAYGWYIFGAVLLNIGHLLDYVDGTLAKATGTVSKFGMYLDKTCDEVVETIIPIAIGICLFPTSIAFLIIGFSCAILHLWSVLGTLHHKEVFGQPNSSKPSLLVSVGVNMKSLTVPAILIFSFIPNGLIVFLIGFLVLTIGEFVYKVRVTGTKSAN